MAAPTTITVEPIRIPVQCDDEVRQAIEQLKLRVEKLATDTNAEVTKLDDRVTTLEP